MQQIYKDVSNIPEMCSCFRIFGTWCMSVCACFFVGETLALCLCDEDIWFTQLIYAFTHRLQEIKHVVTYSVCTPKK